MQVSLRKANALQAAINEALKGLEFKTDISINEFQDPKQEIDSATLKFAKNIDRREALLDALYEIREDTSVANAQNGIDTKLARLARLEKDTAFFAGLTKQNAVTDLEVIKGKLQKISQRTEDSYYAKAEVETGIHPAGAIDIFRTVAARHKKNKQKLQDELLELNVRTTITLSEKTVATLTSEDIL